MSQFVLEFLAVQDVVHVSVLEGVVLLSVVDASVRFHVQVCVAQVAHLITVPVNFRTAPHRHRLRSGVPASRKNVSICLHVPGFVFDGPELGEVRPQCDEELAVQAVALCELVCFEDALRELRVLERFLVFPQQRVTKQRCDFRAVTSA